MEKWNDASVDCTTFAFRVLLFEQHHGRHAFNNRFVDLCLNCDIKITRFSQ